MIAATQHIPSAFACNGVQLQTVDAELSKLEVETRRSQSKLDRMTMELEMYWVSLHPLFALPRSRVR